MADGDGQRGRAARTSKNQRPRRQARGLAARRSKGRPGRGHLRIYLGAAAGVGKTYAMLGEGHRRAERGADVVVAFAETHGRPQTAALLDGLEIIPRARLEYRGASFEEMDLDAVLARQPADRAGGRARAHQRARLAATRSAGRTSRSCSTPGST